MSDEFVEASPASSLTVREVVPQVTVLISSGDGQLMGLIAGESPELASLVKKWCDLDLPAVQRAEHEWVMGQDIYRVSVEWLLGIRFALVSRPWPELLALPSKIPATAQLTLVVTW